jgi:hypothetical protein
MRSCHAIVLIGVSIAGCSGPVPLDGTPSNEVETISQPPASVLRLTDKERALARLEEQRQAIIEAEMDENRRAQLLAQITLREEGLRTCESRGNRIVSFDEWIWCAENYNDGGKVCSDSSECEGACIAERFVQAGVATTGICQAQAPVSACYKEITNGVAGQTSCIN